MNNGKYYLRYNPSKKIKIASRRRRAMAYQIITCHGHARTGFLQAGEEDVGIIFGIPYLLIFIN